jgi:hypothetical protein
MEVVVKYKANRYSKSSQFRGNRRIIQEYGLQEAKRIGALDSIQEQKETKKTLKKQRKFQNKKKKQEEKQKSQKKGFHTGVLYQEKHQEFINNGGDPNACPFD